jgi:hypothetical protein
MDEQTPGNDSTREKEERGIRASPFIRREG